MPNVKRVFTVNGQPFFPIAGQARNSSGYNDAESETAFKAVKLFNGNTLEIPVYWEQLEPEEGKFDFASVDGLLANARHSGIKLVLLWFATWKNGDMDYAPAWVKTNPKRFKRVVAPSGLDIWNLSTHCPENLEADKRAFVELCKHLKAKDSAEHTVIAIQVQNEPGILGCDRDYAPEAQAVFNSPVPADIVARMKAIGKGRVYDLWQAAGGKASGTWSEMFGWAGGELMTAWSIATYIDKIAGAGKAVHDIPMYINVWLGEAEHWAIAGEDYPSGGGVTKVLDLYKWCTPHIDLIAPDIYIADSRGYEATCANYARDDNPLFVPESAPIGTNTWNMFRAVGEYNAIGYALFGIEHLVGSDGAVEPARQPLVDSFRCIAAAIPLLLKYQGTGKIHTVIQEEQMDAMRLDLGDYLGWIMFGSGPAPHARKDWRHSPGPVPSVVPTEGSRSRGLMIQASPKEFYLVGVNFRLFLRPKLSPELSRDATLANLPWLARQTRYVSVDEGHFNEQGEFVVDRRRNGDEHDTGLWVEADTGVVRAILCD
jgi:hypothetical protein